MSPSTRLAERYPMACQRCHKLKVGCDKAVPQCSRCMQARLPCEYKPSERQLKILQGSELVEPAESGDKDEEEGRSRLGSNRATQILPLRHDKYSGTSPPRRPRSSAGPWLDELRRHLYQPAETLLPAKRDRAILSCARCRKHKVRCDRESPCGRCKKLSTEDECVYSLTAPPASSPGDNFNLTLATIAAQAPYHGGDLRFRSRSHWTMVFHHLHTYAPSISCDRQRANAESEAHTHIAGPSINYPFGSETNKQDAVPEDLLQIAPREQLETCVALYLDTIERAYPVLDPRILATEINKSFDQRDAADDDWLALFSAILCLGCQVYINTQGKKSEEWQNMPIRFLRCADYHLKRTPFLFKPSMGNIRTLCLMVLAKQLYAMSCHETDACWHLTGMIVRSSISMGLHLPQQLMDELPEHTESRRRLWTTVVVLDMKQSLTSGLPLLLRLSDIAGLTKTTDMPGIGSALVGGNEEQSAVHMILNDCSDLIFRALEISNCDESSINYENVTELDSALRARLNLIHPGGFGSRVLDSQNSGAAVDLSLYAADIFLRMVLMALHSRFALQPMASIHYPTSYISSLESALSILGYQRDLSEGRRLLAQPMSWFAGFFRYEFLTAYLTVGYHLVVGLDFPGFPLDPGFERQPQDIMLDALQSCRDIWAGEKEVSICSANTFALAHGIVAILRSDFLNTDPDTHLDTK
ncbi:hypothetical protein BX600DRAFT_513351 [Xylariales sp. PMI_506]|nr:hypothetical protein BX600DRAFT_513351 [Xylariales sp. PMI_506]